MIIAFTIKHRFSLNVLCFIVKSDYGWSKLEIVSRCGEKQATQDNPVKIGPSDNVTQLSGVHLL